MKIYCCECKTDIEARLTDGKEIYPHRKDLKSIPFWKCDACDNFVGCHHKTSNPTQPLGCIANSEIKNARIHIHSLLDSFWRGYQNWKLKRNDIYNKLSEFLGERYHTANLRDIETCRKVYKFLLDYKNQKQLGIDNLVKHYQQVRSWK